MAEPVERVERQGEGEGCALAREPAAARVRQLILARILDGVYPPGARLVELRLARELAISQTPVREALRQLEAVGIVRTEPWRGTRVREVSEREMREAYQVRAALEQLAARLAAPRFAGRVDGLRRRVAELRAAARAGDIERYARNDVPFHRAILEASGNSILLRTWEALNFEVRTRVHLARGHSDLAAVAEAHQAVVDALAEGDGRTAGKLLRRQAEAAIPLEECITPPLDRPGRTLATAASAEDRASARPPRRTR